jgi:MoxR-like ATPase
VASARGARTAGSRSAQPCRQTVVPASSPGMAFSAPELDQLRESVRMATGSYPSSTAHTMYSDVYEVGPDSLLFTAALPDQYGDPQAKGILLNRWTPAMAARRLHLIPDLGFYYDHDALLYYCALAYLNNVPLALHGHTGVGKTELVRYFAALMGAPVYRMNLHGLSTTDDIIGKLLPVGAGKVGFQDGLVTTAVRRGGLLLLEEMNATGQEVWFALHGLLDGSRALVLVEKDNEVVVQHSACRIFSTFNPAEYPNLYPGTKELSAAYLRRWASVRVGFASQDVERAIILTQFPDYGCDEYAGILDTMLEVARVARKLLDDRTRSFEFVMSTGVLVTWASLSRFVGPLQGARIAFYDIQNENVKAVFRDQIFSFVTDWDTRQLDSV